MYISFSCSGGCLFKVAIMDWKPDGFTSPCMKLTRELQTLLYLATLTHQTEILLLWKTSRWGFFFFLQKQGWNWHSEMPTKTEEILITEPGKKANCFIPGHMECDSALRTNIYSLVAWGQQNSISSPIQRRKGWLVAGKQNGQEGDLESDKPGLKSTLARQKVSPPSCMRKRLPQAHTEPNL